MSIQLAPEIEAGLRAEAAARGVDVDTLIANALKDYLWKASSPSHPVKLRDRSAEMAWAASPDAQFRNKWVVLDGSQVIASGSDPQQVFEAARAKGESSPFLIFVSADECESFAGGWMA